MTDAKHLPRRRQDCRHEELETFVDVEAIMEWHRRTPLPERLNGGGDSVLNGTKQSADGHRRRRAKQIATDIDELIDMKIEHRIRSLDSRDLWRECGDCDGAGCVECIDGKQLTGTGQAIAALMWKLLEHEGIR